MFRFVLFGFPVVVQWMFWIPCVLIGMGYMKIPGRDGIVGFLVCGFVIFISILLHELGHAWARRRCGLQQTDILLYGMGGLCGGPGYVTRKQQIFISAMGPAVSLGLGIGVWLLGFAPGISGPGAPFAAKVFISTMWWVNFIWGLMNLLPVLPLDGGRIFEAMVANKYPGLAPKVGTIVAGIVAVMGLVLFKQVWTAFLFGYLAYTNYQRSIGVHRGFW